jgi:hypothetical protein
MTDFYHDDPIEEPVVKRAKPKGIFASVLLLLVGGLYLNTTLAANINIGTGGRVEFGQGMTMTTACAGSTALTVTPNSSFVNAAGAGAFYFNTVTVSGIPSSCNGADFTLSVYDSTTSTALPIFATNKSEARIWNDAGTFKLGSGSVNGATITSNSGAFTVSFTAPVALAANVSKLTLQSSSHVNYSCALDLVCAPGDTGPGGGTVFFASSTTFTVTGAPCGSTCKFLEYAPKEWGNGIAVQSGESTGTSTNLPALRWCNGAGATNYVSNIHTANRNWVLANTFGLGFSATQAMANNCTSGSGRTVFDLTFGGASDWFLPSMSEMNELCKYIRGSAGQGTITTACAGGSLPSSFANTHYWTSTESDETPNESAYLFFLGQPGPDDDGKSYTGRILPIRAF